MGLILADTLVAWRDSLKSSEALLQPISFTYDPAVYSLDMWPRSILSIPPCKWGSVTSTAAAAADRRRGRGTARCVQPVSPSRSPIAQR